MDQIEETFDHVFKFYKFANLVQCSMQCGIMKVTDMIFVQIVWKGKPTGTCLLILDKRAYSFKGDISISVS